ncbi:MAG TPA: CPBP family intramembrane glutamic endopeptidase [Rhizomicrobium sp.]|jgi:hypothetical protein|nr:CPBP family intramembrane glutamic endopeptidase [Rhizomicrobium sp.]
MIQMFLEAGMVAGIYLLLALPALGGKQRGWIAAVAIFSFLSTVAVSLPVTWPHAFPAIGKDWNWDGKLCSIAFTTVAAIVLMVFAGFRRTDFGLTFKQAPGTGRAILFGIVPFLIFDAAIVWAIAPHEAVSPETLAFQGTLPGLDEEFLFRGVMLALFDRMFSAKASILGARMGYGALVVSIVFGLVHAVRIDANFAIHTYVMQGVFAGITGLVLVWIRTRTQSLVVPVLTHNALNLINNILPALL